MTLMNDCLGRSAPAAPPAPNKRLNYAFGMVLGVDDFRQEQFHFEWKSRLANLLPHGYGTLCGLGVTTEAAGADEMVTISTGVAISPGGHWCVVQKPQCARLGEWVRRRGAGAPAFGQRVSVYVTLCYEECEVDPVPLAGRACQSEDETRHPSRVLESFRARFAWDPPEQAMEDNVRALGELLHRVEVADEALSPPAGGQGGEDDAALLLEQVRALASAGLSPPAAQSGAGPFRLDPATACETIREALAVWVTEVRPHVGAAGPDGECLPGEKAPDCLLLARLEFDVDAAGQIVSAVTVDERRRPVLLPTRVLQELISCERAPAPITVAPQPPAPAPPVPVLTFATLFLLNGTTVRAWLHHPQPVTLPREAVTIQVDGAAAGAAVVPASVAAPVAGLNVFDLQLPAGQTVADGSRVTVRFDLRLVTESGPPARPLDAILADTAWDFSDRVETTVNAYLATPRAAAGPVPGIPRHPDLADLNASDDHPRYLPTAGPRPADPDLNLNGKRVFGLGPGAAAPDEAVRFDRAVKTGDPAAGGLSGTYPNPAVRRGQFVLVRDEQPPREFTILAAGCFNQDLSPFDAGSVYNLKLSETDPNNPTVVRLDFQGYDFGRFQRGQYVVKGTVIMRGGTDRSPVFHVVDTGNNDPGGILVQITDGEGERPRGVMIEISALFAL